MILFDKDMTILYTGNDAQTIQTKLKELTGKQVQVPDGTCKNSCGKQAPAGCYCDDDCKGYGDCCKDVCEVCGLSC